MYAVPSHRNDLLTRLGLDQPTPLALRHEAARDLIAEILCNLDNTSRAHEFSERAAYILHGDAGDAMPASLRMTAHRLCEFVASHSDCA